MVRQSHSESLIYSATAAAAAIVCANRQQRNEPLRERGL